MLKRIIPLLAVLAALFWSRKAEATHFRYGTIAWTVPSPQTAPLAVTFTVTTAWRATLVGQTVLNFGDNTATNPQTIGTSIGIGTDAGGNDYAVTQYTVAHTYASAGTYTVFFQGGQRIVGLINGSNASYRVETKVGLSPGNTSGPISAAPALIQMQVGGVRTYTFPAYDPDGDAVTCRFATSAEMWSSNAADGITPPAAQDIPREPIGNKIPTLSNGPTGCIVTWDLTQAAPGDQYVIHLVLESTHGGQVSSTAIDLIIELVTPPPPTCAGSGTFVAPVGQLFTATTTGTIPGGGGGTLTLNATNAPVGSIVNPASGLSGPSPYSNTFTWTPTAASAGTALIVTMNYKAANNLSGACFLTIVVPQCSNFGEVCTVGVGECQKSGTNVCAGPGVTVCSVLPGVPGTEICDGKDNDCDGTVDDGNPGGGVACSSGLPGVCSAGTTACTAGAVKCNATITPGSQMETCDSKDNNCDGTVDEGFNLGQVCTSGVGACATTGVLVCDPAGATACNGIPGMPLAEVCTDMIDNDCDGVVNNGCLDTDGDGLPDAVETAIGTDPNDADSDDDGVIDGQEPSPSEDSDGDGLINALDPDSDNDGLYDGTEMGKDCSNPATDLKKHHCIPDGDMGATKTNPLIADSDAGGVKDGSEDANRNGVVDPGETDPTPGNGEDDLTVVDSDGDGLSDIFETAIGTNPNDADSDDDGVIDGLEPNPADDTDGDGLIDALDVDSDNDGLYDGTEMGKDCSSPATDNSKHHCIPDGDNGATKTSPLDPDTDHGGVKDGSEDINRDGVIDPGETDPTTGHGGDDSTLTDSDGDGLTDVFETAIGTDPNDADTDNDGVIDGQEPNPADDTDGDGLINAVDPDSDNDGLYDGTEMGKDCNNPATDNSLHHCIPDGDKGVTTTSPLDPDTDHGGVKDGSEDADRDGVVDPGETDPTSGHGADDSTLKDSDGDGLTDIIEVSIGTNPMDADSDDDGVIDGQEPNPADDTDGDGLINALDVDSDNDGLYDGTELGKGCSDPATDATKKHCIPDGDMGMTVTNPLDADTDDGGVSDGSEDINRNGVVDGTETDPTEGHGADDSTLKDSDGDGLSDVFETAIGTDPNDADSDDDGLIDGQEPNPADDTDGDGKINALDPDSDDDGLFDGTELGKDCGNPATDATKMQCIADADKGTTKTNPLDADTDKGSVKDGVEDANHNGQVDAGETDPNVKADDLNTGCRADADCGAANSGKVCDEATKACVDGCRGNGGNTCPDGKVCSSQSAVIGTCTDGAGGAGGGGGSDRVVASGNGLICSATPGNNNDGATWLLGGAIAALVGWRRRRRAA